jgi:hypothetical protein
VATGLASACRNARRNAFLEGITHANFGTERGVGIPMENKEDRHHPMIP